MFLRESTKRIVNEAISKAGEGANKTGKMPRGTLGDIGSSSAGQQLQQNGCLSQQQNWNCCQTFKSDLFV